MNKTEEWLTRGWQYVESAATLALCHIDSSVPPNYVDHLRTCLLCVVDGRSCYHLPMLVAHPRRTCVWMMRNVLAGVLPATHQCTFRHNFYKVCTVHRHATAQWCIQRKFIYHNKAKNLSKPILHKLGGLPEGHTPITADYPLLMSAKHSTIQCSQYKPGLSISLLVTVTISGVSLNITIYKQHLLTDEFSCRALRRCDDVLYH